MKTTMRYKSVLVTGGSGFVGQHLLPYLSNKGFSVRCFDRMKPLWLTSDIEFIEGDLSAPHILEPSVEGMDVIVHLVSTTLPKTSNDDPQFDAISNLIGTIGLIELAVKHGIKRMIFISSGGTVYGRPYTIPMSESHPTNPLCSYGIIKLTIEKYLRMYYDLYGLKSVSLRLSNLYGEHQRVDTGQGAVTVFCHKAVNGAPIDIWGDGSVARDFLYVKDAIDAIFKAILSDHSGMEINIGSGKSISLNQTIACIEKVLGKNVKRRYLPGRSFDINEVCLDILQARQLLGWMPSTDLQDGIRLMVNWLAKGNPV
ncbi:MAG: NAD-dependent epimerase/dehydratase family protein [Smithella sp.]|jgi:UDP-glucose 4-epimerase